MHRRFRRVAVAVAAVVLVAIAGGVTYAVADIGGGGVITGCYKSQNGQLRVIDPATDHCLPSDLLEPDRNARATRTDGTRRADRASGAEGRYGPDRASGADGASGPEG
jgi:hypothetical protein